MLSGYPRRLNASRGFRREKVISVGFAFSFAFLFSHPFPLYLLFRIWVHTTPKLPIPRSADSAKDRANG